MNTIDCDRNLVIVLILLVLGVLNAAQAQPAAENGSLKPFTRPPGTVSAPAEASRTVLGRIFFTPSERQTLDAGEPLNLSQGEQINTSPNLVSIKSWVLDGYLLRNGRLEAVWVNGRIPAANSELTVTRSAKPDGVTLLDAQKKPLVEGLKTGQKVNIDKREILDPLPQGAIIKRTSR
jgi:hypothetical protein